MTLCYKLFDRPRTWFEFLDKARRRNVREIDLYVWTNKEGPKKTFVDVQVDKPYYRSYSLCKRPLQQDVLSTEYVLNRSVVEGRSFEQAVHLANRLRAGGFIVRINDRPIGYAEDVLQKYNDRMDKLIKESLADEDVAAIFATIFTPQDEHE